MSRRCISAFFFVLFIALNGKAQFGNYSREKEFLKHLSVQRLYTEKLFLLAHMSDTAPQLFLEKGWTFLEAGMPDSSAWYYHKVNFDTIVKYGFLPDYFLMLFKTRSWDKVKNHLSLHDTLLQDQNGRKIYTSYNLSTLKYAKNDPALKELPLYLSTHYQHCYQASRKSGVLAGVLSATIPGLGKWYNGKKVQALNMFLVNAVLGLQAYESYRKAGMNSPRFFIFGGAFSFFYLSDIVGSICGVRKNKSDHARQLNYEITEHYLDHFNNYPR